MDIFTHLASGYLLKENFIKEKNKIFLFFFLISAIAPDIDILWSGNNISLHRVLTHSLILAPFFAFLIGIVFYSFTRKEYNFGFLKIYLISFSGILIHIFLDSIVVWGVPLFYPFSDKYFSFNLYTYIYEPVFFIIFILILFFSLLQKFTKFQFSYKYIIFLNILFLTIFFIRISEHFYAGKLSGFSNAVIISRIEKLTDFIYYNRYKVISSENGYFKTKFIDIFNNENSDIKIFKKYKNNGICSSMHNGFLFQQKNLIGDIRYTNKLYDMNSCFNGVKFKE